MKIQHIYKGWTIEKRNASFLCDKEFKGVSYYIYSTGKTSEDSCAVEITPSLYQAKLFIDRLNK
jgi:hypothetical protein